MRPERASSEAAPGSDSLLERWQPGLERAGLRAVRDDFSSRLLARAVVDLRWTGCGQTPADAGPALVGLCRDAAATAAPWLLAARLPAGEAACREALERCGFHLVECHLLLRHALVDLPAPDPGRPLRDAAAADVPALRTIASGAFEFSRMHLDPRIPRELADRSRADWVENSVRGRAERVLVAEVHDEPAGFACCMARRGPDAPVAVLDLIAVARGQRRQGVGAALLHGFFDWARDGRFASAEVGTQVQNLPAVRMYEEAGFRTAAASYTYHLHLPAEQS